MWVGSRSLTTIVYQSKPREPHQLSFLLLFQRACSKQIQSVEKFAQKVFGKSNLVKCFDLAKTCQEHCKEAGWGQDDIDCAAPCQADVQKTHQGIIFRK